MPQFLAISGPLNMLLAESEGTHLEVPLENEGEEPGLVIQTFTYRLAQIAAGNSIQTFWVPDDWPEEPREIAARVLRALVATLTQTHPAGGRTFMCLAFRTGLDPKDKTLRLRAELHLHAANHAGIISTFPVDMNVSDYALSAELLMHIKDREMILRQSAETAIRGALQPVIQHAVDQLLKNGGLLGPQS